MGDLWALLFSVVFHQLLWTSIVAAMCLNRRVFLRKKQGSQRCLPRYRITRSTVVKKPTDKRRSTGEQKKKHYLIVGGNKKRDAKLEKLLAATQKKAEKGPVMKTALSEVDDLKEEAPSPSPVLWVAEPNVRGKTTMSMLTTESAYDPQQMQRSHSQSVSEEKEVVKKRGAETKENKKALWREEEGKSEDDDKKASVEDDEEEDLSLGMKKTKKKNVETAMAFKKEEEEDSENAALVTALPTDFVPEKTVKNAKKKFPRKTPKRDGKIVIDRRNVVWSFAGGTEIIKLTNETGVRQAVKMQCSDSLLYKISPTTTFVEPDRTVEISVTRKPSKQPKSDFLAVMNMRATESDTNVHALYAKKKPDQTTVVELHLF